MKIKSRVLVYVLPIFIIAMFMLVMFSPFVSADDKIETPSAEFPELGTPDSNITRITDNIWGTTLNIAQILAFAAIVFAGVRYMFASADQKADIKKGIIYLIIGAILVFTASTVVKLIVLSTKQVAPKALNEIVYNIENV